MENNFEKQNTITTKGFSQTGKNSTTQKIEYKYKTIFLSKKLPQNKRITYYPIKKNFSDFALTNRQINEEIFPYKNISSTSKNKIVRKFKLEPIIKKKLINDESNTFDLRKNKSYINTNIRNRMNESIQSDLFYEEEMQHKLIKHQNSMIDYLLNKKMEINKKPKLKKINSDKINIIDNLKYFYGKGIFLERFEKKFLQNSKPVHHFFKEDKIKYTNLNSNSSNKSNISIIMRKTNNFLKNKNIYELVQFGNRVEKVATKLIIDENENKNDNNFDFHCLMKYPLNSKNISMYSSNYSNILSNFSSSFKTKNKIRMRNTKNKENNSLMRYEDIKILSQKGFERMKKNRYKGFEKLIGQTIENVKSNRKKYDSLVDINMKIYNKNKIEVLNNEL